MKLVLHQLDAIYWTTKEDQDVINECMDLAADRVGKCFTHIKNKYYQNIPRGEVCVPTHIAQYTSFLYYLSNTIYHHLENQGYASDLCDRIYGLSKLFSSADLFYQVSLPDIIFFDHPQGAVIGRAQYGDYFSFGQGCTVGNNHGVYPVIGERVAMLSSSKIIGKCRIGRNTIISANTYIKDQDVPENSLVFGMSPNLSIVENEAYINEFMDATYRF